MKILIIGLLEIILTSPQNCPQPTLMCLEKMGGDYLQCFSILYPNEKPVLVSGPALYREHKYACDLYCHKDHQVPDQLYEEESP